MPTTRPLATLATLRAVDRRPAKRPGDSEGSGGRIASARLVKPRPPAAPATWRCSPSGVHHRIAFAATGNHQCASMPMGAGHRLGFAEQLIIIRPGTHRPLELDPVGLQDGRTGIAGEGFEFRVHHHRHARVGGQFKQRFRLRQRAFVIVLQDDGRQCLSAAANFFSAGSQLLLEAGHLSRAAAADSKVRAQKLLLLTQHPEASASVGQSGTVRKSQSNACCSKGFGQAPAPPHRPLPPRSACS